MSVELRFDKKGIKVFKGDNMEVLQQLEPESLDLIYCDILYNSGKLFDDYSDNLGSPIEAVEWYRPRFKLMKKVLKKTGSIYIHCNWRLDSYMRVLLDEIFGFNNFRNRIYRKHSDIRGFVENYDSQMDVILYYTKDRYNFTFNELKGDKLRTIPLFENGYLKERSYTLDYKGIYYDSAKENKHLLLPKCKIEELCDKGEVILIDGQPYRKTYSIPVGNLWDGDDMLDPYSRTNTAESYDTPKPEAVLKRIIEISSNKGDTIGDFFMGGGRIALEAIKSGRKGVFCDISEKACNITTRNLKNYINENK